VNTVSATDTPQRLEAKLRGASQLIAGNRHAEAIQLLQEVAEHPIAGLPARSLIALAAALSGDHERARSTLQTIAAADSIRKVEVLLAAGSAWFKLAVADRAIEYLSAAQKLQPDHPLVRARLGACLLGAGQVGSAMPHLQRAVELMPDSGGAWLNLARGQMLSGDSEQALQSLDKAEPLPDKEPEIYSVTRAEVLNRLGRRQEAVAQLRKAVAQGQDDAVPTVVTMLAAQGEHDQAWQTLREEIDRKPDDVRLLELAAELAQVRGRFIESDRFLDRALQIEPDNAALWWRRAMMAGRRLGSESGRAAADRAMELTQGEGGLSYAQALTAHGHVLNVTADQKARLFAEVE
jgi:tetratricopeptide (TPR) repeat protein